MWVPHRGGMLKLGHTNVSLSAVVLLVDYVSTNLVSLQVIDRMFKKSLKLNFISLTT